MRKLFVLLVILLLGLYATNPTKLDFKEFAYETVKTDVKNAGITSSEFFNSLLASLSGNITETAVDILVKRKNYYIYSIYTVEGKDCEHKYLGIFRNFYKLEQDYTTVLD